MNGSGGGEETYECKLLSKYLELTPPPWMRTSKGFAVMLGDAELEVKVPEVLALSSEYLILAMIVAELDFQISSFITDRLDLIWQSIFDVQRLLINRPSIPLYCSLASPPRNDVTTLDLRLMFFV